MSPAGFLAALIAGSGVFLALTGLRRRVLGDRLSGYLGEGTTPRHQGRRRRATPMPSPNTLSRLTAAGGGAALGGLLAAGQLFATARPASAPALITLGAGGGLLWHRLRRKQAADARALRLRRELPTVADTLALSVLAGESVAGAIERFTTTSRGVAAEELGTALARHRTGCGLAEALTGTAQASAHAEGTRLYELLGHAHQTGGRLADALADLAIDYRAALARDLTAEGGRRALAAYGPILALMVPVTLLFLMYPTLTGLSALSHPTP
jgi:tight adherence protein C